MSSSSSEMKRKSQTSPSTSRLTQPDDNKTTSKLQKSDVRDAATDRLSALPDDALLRILAFLDTKLAVATSILSKRWRHLWTRLPNLTLSDAQLCFSGQTTQTHVDSFPSIVERVLKQHQNLHALSSFRLSCTRTPLDSSILNPWIEAVAAAAGPDLEVLDINVGWKKTVIELTQSIFTMKQLHVLKLSGSIQLRIPADISFPYLGILELNGCSVEDCHSLGRFISCSPVLDTLYITRNVGYEEEEEVDDDDDYDDEDEDEEKNYKTLYVESSSLLKLVMTIQGAKQRVVLKAPKLVHFDLKDFVVAEYEVGNLPSLASAKLLFGNPDIDYDPLDCDGVIVVLKQIANVSKLHLTMQTVELIETSDILQELPKFRNVTHLTVEVIGIRWRSLHRLLVCSPCLVTLVIEKVGRHRFESYWKAQRPDPKCLLSRIEVIEIKGFEAYEAETKIATKMLKVGAVLKKMILHCYKPSFDEQRNLKALLAAPRASDVCQVEQLVQKPFDWDDLYFSE